MLPTGAAHRHPLAARPDPGPPRLLGRGAIAGCAHENGKLRHRHRHTRDTKLRRGQPTLRLFGLQRIEIERRVAAHPKIAGGDGHPVESQRRNLRRMGRSRPLGLRVGWTGRSRLRHLIRVIQPTLRQHVLQIILGAAHQEARLRVTELSSVRRGVDSSGVPIESTTPWNNSFDSLENHHGDTENTEGFQKPLCAPCLCGSIFTRRGSAPAITGCGCSPPIATDRRSSRASPSPAASVDPARPAHPATASARSRAAIRPVAPACACRR